MIEGVDLRTRGLKSSPVKTKQTWWCMFEVERAYATTLKMSRPQCQRVPSQRRRALGLRPNEKGPQRRSARGLLQMRLRNLSHSEAQNHRRV